MTGKAPITDEVREARRQRMRRIVRRTIYTKLAILLGMVVVVGAVYLRLFAGPVSLQNYSERVATALASRLGPGWHVVLSDTAAELVGAKPALRASGIEIRNPAGGIVLRAPYAMVSLDPMSLMIGSLHPREIELRDLQLRLLIAADGSLSLVPPGTAPPQAEILHQPAPMPPPQAPGEDAHEPSQLSTAVASALDAVLDPSGLVGSLDRAVLTNARVTLVGADGRERAGFDKVGAAFTRVHGLDGRMDVQVEGPNGPWRIGGRFGDDGRGRRSADLQASEVPLTDLMLLTGLSHSAAGTDLRLSSSLKVALADGTLAALGGAFDTSSGAITRPGQPPLQINRISGEASWDEAGRRIVIAGADVKSRATAVRLSGELSRGDVGWRLKLAGHDAVMAGVTAKDPDFKVADIGAELNFDDSGVALDRLSVKGDGLDATMSGASVPGGNGTGARALIEAHDTDIRKLFAFWPPEVNADLRQYLVDNMVSGALTRMRLKTDLNADELQNITNNKPVSDEAVSLTFGLARMQLNVFEGLPPLRDVVAEGKSSGTRISIGARSGHVDMPDGRRLEFSDGLYDQPNLDKRDSVARISFRLDGGADALASLLRSPALKQGSGGGSFEIDPANVRGRAAMKVTLPLAVHNVPKPADMPLVVAGTLSDLTLEKALGRERLESANLAVAFDSGALSIKGDGKVGGSPASVDLRQPKGAPGEILVNLTLDEAARTRRSLPSSPQVTGLLPVKVTLPFGPGAKGPMRLEADLTRTAIDGLLPGWTKPANRPGRLSFSVAEGGSGELRDLVLDSGATQLRGTAVVGPDGTGLEKADLSMVKLSPGDDLRAQLDKSATGYRVSVKGNVGDARPVLKWLTSPPAGAGAGQKGREQADLDLDFGINIVTGYNDEALTGVTGTVSTRKGDLRALSLRGQFRSAVLDAQLARRDGAAPVLTVQSNDAGATFRFVDLYRRMVGGTLKIVSSQGDGAQTGTVSVGDFTIRNEPALKQIAAREPTAGASWGDDHGPAQVTRLDADQVHFVKLTGEFRRTPARTDFKDIVVWGPAVGFNLSGYLDTARDRTEVNGTFVPAYGLNNAFSQLPIIGLILGGDRNEGLFAINFKVSGPTSAPTTTFNPISAVAPGILRKIFGFIMQDYETTTGTVPQAPPAAAR